MKTLVATRGHIKSQNVCGRGEAGFQMSLILWLGGTLSHYAGNWWNISQCVDGSVCQPGSSSGGQMQSKLDGMVKLTTSSSSCRCVNVSKINVWVDAKSLATGVVLKRDGAIWRTHAGVDQQTTPNISNWLNCILQSNVSIWPYRAKQRVYI